MADFPCIINAEIESADIVFDRGFILSAWLFLKWGGGSVQGFGGYALGGSPFDTDALVAQHGDQTNIAADFIGGIMAVAGVEKWSALPGRIIRVGKTDEWGDILSIGHPIRDRWYVPKERFHLLQAAGASD